jgi:hypothetical protein
MRVLNKDKLITAKLTPHESFFVELWYSMTHMQSLDSYRVKCMNSRMIVRELCEELKIAIIKNEELKGLCDEVTRILKNDPVIQNDFQTFAHEVSDRIEKFPQIKGGEKKKQQGESRERIHLDFVVSDFSAELEKSYFEKLTSYLQRAIKPDNENEIKLLVDSLLSDLLDKGWPLETLFDWHRHFLKKKKKDYSFSENLAFMLKIFTSPPLEHLVSLRLQGGKKLEQLKRFEDFSFVGQVDIASDHPQKKKFQTGQSLGFAQINVKGVDFLSAAIQAREQFEQLADLLRFDFEPSKLQVDRLCHVKRLRDTKEDFPYVRTAVPNPTEKNEYQDFNAFAHDLDIVSCKTEIEESSRTQLQAAIRQYRFGRDSENYKDKFLNWWMGLEALTRVDKKKDIGSSVTFNVSRVMAIPYLHRLIRDLLTTLKYSKIYWPQELVDISGCNDLEQLTVNQLIAVLQSEEAQNKLWEQCTAIPTLSFRGRELGDFLRDPQKTAKRLKEHVEHLEWHLNRIYRIRCCIVHGALIRFRLGLITANLEFYLKQVIQLVLKTFRNYDHIGSLSEFFHRAEFSYERTIESLEKEGAGPEQVKIAAFMDYAMN